MSTISLLSLLPLILLWAVYRIGRHAVAPLLADARAASMQPSRVSPLPSASNEWRRAGRWTRALVAGITAFLAYLVLSRSGVLMAEAAISFPLSATFAYQYNPYLDLGLVAALALCLGLFEKIGRGMALASFAVLFLMLFLYDFLFNLFGAMNFPTQSDFFYGHWLGQYIWIIYYVGYTTVLTAALGLFSRNFRTVWPWLTILTSGVLGGAYVSYPMTNDITALVNDLQLMFAVPPIITAAVAGWWMKPSAAS